MIEIEHLASLKEIEVNW